MTVTSMVPHDTPHLPQKVTEVSREVLRSFPHCKKVGNYLLGNTIGEGSFAKVKEALHIPTGERVAVKIIDKQKTREDSYVRKNLRREGKILQMIRHQNIIQLLEIMETQNSYYLVTDLCRGGDLMDYISQRRKLPELEVKKFVRQIVSAIDYLHRLGILHRDLKIENLLLDENNDMKIIDFGLSNAIKVVQTKEGTKAQEFCVTQCGSPAYAAPELLGRRKYGPQVDVWSIGVNMYAMLTGNLPFTVEPFNIKTLHTKMVNSHMNPLPEGISRDCRDLIRKFLTPDPDRRIRIPEVMKHPWITEGSYVNLPRPGAGAPMSRAPCPNKIKSSSLDNSILKHMSDNLDFRVGEVIRFVTNNLPSSATAMYHLLLRKLEKHYGNLRATGRIAADPRLLGRPQQFQTTQPKDRRGSLAKPNQTRIGLPRSLPTTNNAPRPSASAQNKVVALVASRTAKEKQSDKTSQEQELEQAEEGDEGFTDLLGMKMKNGVTLTGRMKSVLKGSTPQNTTAAGFLPSVAKKYVVGSAQKRAAKDNTVNSAQVIKAKSKPGDHQKENDDIMSDCPETDDGYFRKRASTFPGKTCKPTITVNRKLLNQVQNERRDSLVADRDQSPTPSVSGGRKNSIPGAAGPHKGASNGHQMYYLLRRQQAGGTTQYRPSVNSNSPSDVTGPYNRREGASRQASPDSDKPYPQTKHLLSRTNARSNKLQRLRSEGMSDSIEEQAPLISTGCDTVSPGHSVLVNPIMSVPSTPVSLPGLVPATMVTAARRS